MAKNTSESIRSHPDISPQARLSLTHAKITSLAHADVTCTCKSFYYITCTCTHLLGGVGGMITFLGLAHILVYAWWVGRVGWVGWVGGVGGVITYLDRLEENWSPPTISLHLQIRSFNNNFFFCTTRSLLRTTLDPASCWLSQAYIETEHVQATETRHVQATQTWHVQATVRPFPLGVSKKCDLSVSTPQSNVPVGHICMFVLKRQIPILLNNGNLSPKPQNT